MSDEALQSIPALCSRCHREERVPGKRTCPACLQLARNAARRATAAWATPTTDTHRTCTVCKVSKPHSDFTKERRCKSGLQAQCRACRTAYVVNRRHTHHGTMPMRRRVEVDGKLSCSRCLEWLPVEVFHIIRSKDHPVRRASQCKVCVLESREELKSSPRCKCRQPVEPGEEACSTCLDRDGRSAMEGTVISALRVLGGEAQMAAIVEDIGGDINEDPNSGPGYRRAYRGMAALRKNGMVETTTEKAEASRKFSGEIAVHRLKGGR